MRRESSIYPWGEFAVTLSKVPVEDIVAASESAWAELIKW